MWASSSFSSASFDTRSFQGMLGEQPQEGRSGYWRLFFIQLQEQALKKDEEKNSSNQLAEKQAIAEQVLENKPIQKQVIKQRKKSNRLKVKVDEPEHLPPLPPLHVKSPTSEDSSLQAAYHNAVWQASNLFTFALSRITIAMGSIAQNDSEDELLLLLVA